MLRIGLHRAFLDEVGGLFAADNIVLLICSFTTFLLLESCFCDDLGKFRQLDDYHLLRADGLHVIHLVMTHFLENTDVVVSGQMVSMRLMHQRLGGIICMISDRIICADGINVAL